MDNLLQDTAGTGRSKVLGIWDLSQAPLTLGGLLLFIEELQIQLAMTRAESIEVAIIGKPVLSPDSPLVSVLTGMEHVAGHYCMASMKELEGSLDLKAYKIWPPVMEKKYLGDNTLFLQKFFREQRSLPSLSCRKDLRTWAVDYFASLGKGCPVAVHLKNNPRESGCSNARQDVWLDFFRSRRSHDVVFILIGDDVIDPRILALDHVRRGRLDGSDLPRDLAIVQMANFFMGMSSGPCNMAILNQRPFVIFKNPDHHVEEMQKEMGSAKQFIFSQKTQRFLREYETFEALSGEFERMYQESGCNNNNQGSC